MFQSCVLFPTVFTRFENKLRNFCIHQKDSIWVKSTCQFYEPLQQTERYPIKKETSRRVRQKQNHRIMRHITRPFFKSMLQFSFIFKFILSKLLIKGALPPYKFYFHVFDKVSHVKQNMSQVQDAAFSIKPLKTKRMYDSRKNTMQMIHASATLTRYRHRFQDLFKHFQIDIRNSCAVTTLRIHEREKK